jgi:hypothetical protein
MGLTPRIDDREFQVWEYRVGHGQLLIRSPRRPGSPTRPERTTNVDVVFVGVDYMSLPRSFAGLAIEMATESEVKAVEALIDFPLGSSSRVFVLVSGRKRFPVAAVAVKVSENDWDIFESPFDDRRDCPSP